MNDQNSTESRYSIEQFVKKTAQRDRGQGTFEFSSVRLENCSGRKTGLRTAPIRFDCKFLDFELFFQLNLYHVSSSQNLIQIEWQK